MQINNLVRGPLKGLISGVVLLGASVACNNSPETFFSTNTDKFTAHLSDNYEQASELLQADYVFVLDYSYSMSQNGGSTSKIQTLLDSMELFTNELVTEGIDYKIGVIKGVVHANNEDEIPTDFLSEALTPETTGNLFDSILEQLSPAGLPLAENTNYLLESARRVMTAQGSSFLREGSQAIYIFVSDSDDRSQTNSGIPGNTSSEAYAQFLRNTKSHPSYVSARALVVGEAGSTCPSRNTGYGGDVPGTRIANTVFEADSGRAQSSQIQTSYCIYNRFEESLADLARNVTRPTERFTLRGTPVPSSVKVFENGAEVSQERYSYKTSTNEVVFKSGMAPALSASLEIVYSQLFKLKLTPKAESLSVIVNGKTLNSADFSYVASENRIEFSASKAPREGDDIRISYQAQ